jgi:hypothetical protein
MRGREKEREREKGRERSIGHYVGSLYKLEYT